MERTRRLHGHMHPKDDSTKLWTQVWGEEWGGGGGGGEGGHSCPFQVVLQRNNYESVDEANSAPSFLSCIVAKVLRGCSGVFCLFIH